MIASSKSAVMVPPQKSLNFDLSFNNLFIILKIKADVKGIFEISVISI